MKIIPVILIILSACLTGCAQNSLPDGFPVEVGDSCAEAEERIYFEGLYRSERSTCGNYYCWTFIRFYEDCTYLSAGSFYETPQKGFLIEPSDNYTSGVYSIENSTIKMKSDANQALGEINQKTLALATYNSSTKKIIEREYIFIPVEAILQDLLDAIEGAEQQVK